MPKYMISPEVAKCGEIFEALNENDAYRLARQYILDYAMASKPETLVIDVTEQLDDSTGLESIGGSA